MRLSRVAAMPLLAMLAILTGCSEPVPDDHASWYGPVIRKMNSLPSGIYRAECYKRGSACLADPGARWSTSDVTTGAEPTGQLVWARRMGGFYVVDRIEGGNITTQFDVFDETTFENVWPTDSYLFATGRMPPPPAGLDARIVRVVRYAYTNIPSCGWGESPEGGAPEECKHWPLN
jgi:hypothetical protein